MSNGKIKTLATEWGIPLALGVGILGSCAAGSYLNGDSAETAEHKKPGPGREEVIVISPVTFDM